MRQHVCKQPVNYKMLSNNKGLLLFLLFRVIKEMFLKYDYLQKNIRS